MQITQAHVATYRDPIAFAEGVSVTVGREDPDGPGWFWCREPGGKEGWVHRSFLAEAAGVTTSTRAYSARELTVTGGERGTVLTVLDGWAEVRLDTGETGWAPEGHCRLESE